MQEPPLDTGKQNPNGGKENPYGGRNKQLTCSSVCWKGGGGHFLEIGYWGCAAEWAGRIFTTGQTITGSPFQTFPIEFLE